MGGDDSEQPTQRRIDGTAKAAFLAALRTGLKRDDAAAHAGFTATAFYYARRRDRVFDLACAWAMDLSAADERSARAAADPLAAIPGDVAIAPNSNRALQARPVRRPLFDDRRKRIFLDHFAGTADAHAAAAAAGVAYVTVTQHRRKDAEFAVAWDEALAVAYAALEAEVVRQRLDAQRNFRDGLCPTGEIATEFERVMKLLARYDRGGGRIGLRQIGQGGEKRATFDEAIEWLDRKLEALGVRRNLLPPPSDDAAS